MRRNIKSVLAMSAMGAALLAGSHAFAADVVWWAPN